MLVFAKDSRSVFLCLTQYSRSQFIVALVDDARLVKVKQAKAELTVECRKDGYAVGRVVVLSYASKRTKIELPVGFFCSMRRLLRAVGMRT